MYADLYAEKTPLSVDIFCPAVAPGSPGFDVSLLRLKLEQMRNFVSPGHDQVTVGMLKCCGDDALQLVADCFNSRFLNNLDTSWDAIPVSLLPKIQNATKAKHFRPTAVLSTLYKLYELCLWSFAPANVQDLLDDEHFGFRKNYQALESVSTLRLLAEKCMEFKRALVMCKTDIAKAFDSVSHESILHALRFHNIDEAVIYAILREIRHNSMVFRLPDGSTTKPISQQRGVRQGGTISPIIFVLVMNFALHGLFRDWNARGLGITLQDNTSIAVAIFADDALLLAANWQDMQTMLSEFAAALSLHGLEIQEDQCCCMCNEFSAQGCLALGAHSILSVDGVTGFVFLGTSLTLDGSYVVEVRDRIAKGWRTSWRLRSWLLRRSVSVGARLKLWRAALRATAFWGSGSWRLPRQLGEEPLRAERAM